MLEDIQKELEQETLTPFHTKLLTKAKALVALSRGGMSKYYEQWNYYDMSYRGERELDKDDTNALQRGEVAKVAIPLTYAQVQVFVAFLFSQFYQRAAFYELKATGEEDYDAAKVGEAFLTRDLNESQFSQKMMQFGLDIGRFGIGILNTGWVKEEATVWKKITQEITTPFGTSFENTDNAQQTPVQEVSFEGNRVYNISPFRFFPDIRLPLTRWEEGEFVASEDEYSYVALKKLEHAGEVAGLQWIPNFTKGEWDSRKTQFTGMVPDNVANSGIGGGTALNYSKDTASTLCVTAVQMWLIPNEFRLGGDEKTGKPLGDEDYPVLYHVWYANDARIIKAEPLGYSHNKFTYQVAQFSPDQHRLINDGISGLIGQLQDVINWLMNSRITSVRKVISNFLVVDPQKIDIADIINKKPVIKTKPGLGQLGVDRAVKQLNVQDVTTGHVADIQVLQGLISVITGVSESALGQFAKGRRSAREAGNVFNATLNRLQMIARVIWDTALQPMGRKMLSNLRDGITTETYVRVMGDMADMKAYNGFVKVGPESLIGSYDFEMYDGTLPSDKQDMAQALQQVLVTIISNPESAQLFNLNPSALLREIASLKGIKHIQRFNLRPDDVQQQYLAQQAGVQPGSNQLPNGNGGPSVPPSGPAGGAVQPSSGGASAILSQLAGLGTARPPQ